MMLVEGITLHRFDAGNWVIHTPQERNFLVNRATYQLITLLNESSNTEMAIAKFNDQFNISLNEQQFKQLIAEKLGGYQILKNDSEPEKPTLQNQYLKIKIQLINAHIAGILSKPFQVFYHPKVFWWAMLAGILAEMSVYFVSNTDAGLNQINYPLLVGLVYATMLIHELGHIGACANYGLKHGGIGFGFYFIMPVMYADITNIWLADKPRRMIANLAGIFNEVMYAALLGIIYVVTDDATFWAASIGIFSFVVWEFNPFVRFDGYWVLSDLTNTPNLLLKANAVFKDTVRQRKWLLFFTDPAKQLNAAAKREVWLFFYGFVNNIFWVAIMTYTLVAYWDTVIRFPVILWELGSKMINLQIPKEQINSKLVTVLIFYTLIIRMFIRQLNKITISGNNPFNAK